MSDALGAAEEAVAIQERIVADHRRAADGDRHSAAAPELGWALHLRGRLDQQDERDRSATESQLGSALEELDYCLANLDRVDEALTVEVRQALDRQ